MVMLEALLFIALVIGVAAVWWWFPRWKLGKLSAGVQSKAPDDQAVSKEVQAMLAVIELRATRPEVGPLNLFKAALSKANLSEANLRAANLRAAELSEADLRAADLRAADLSEATLSGANLARADLSEATLTGADLSGADLSEANLFGANLSRADLSGANLSGADLFGAKNLTQEQLDTACGDDDTKLPEGLTIKPCEPNATP